MAERVQMQNKTIKKVGVILRPSTPELKDDFFKLEKIFNKYEIEVVIDNISGGMIGIMGMEFDLLCQTTNMLVTLGGDGTLISVARRSFKHNIPILGVYAGNLGFLADINIDELDNFVETLVAGNYRIDEMRSALGLVQLDKLEEANSHREKLTKRYIENLKECKLISIPFVKNEHKSVYHIFPILLDKKVDRIEVINKLKEFGIQSSIHYPAFKDFTAFKDMGLNSCPVAEDIAKRELTLPLYPTMSFDEVDYVSESLKKILGAIK